MLARMIDQTAARTIGQSKMLLSAALASATLGAATAQDNVQQDAASPISEASLVVSDANNVIAFEPAKTRLSSQEIQVFDGVEPQQGDWSSIVITKTGDGVGAFHCTATFVGRNAVLTAAHCVVTGTATQPSSIKIGDLNFRCTVDEYYLKGSPGASGVRNYFDYALCAASAEAARPVVLEQVRWERIDLNPVAPGRALLLAGYGCTDWSFTPGSNPVPVKKDAKLTIGDFRVATASADYFTSVTDGRTRSAICAGDSGGPVFAGISVDSLSGTRTIQGIASKNPPIGEGITSYFTALSSQRFQDFLACWISKNSSAGIQIKPVPGQKLASIC